MKTELCISTVLFQIDMILLNKPYTENLKTTISQYKRFIALGALKRRH
jgi:hypothetical protein